MDIVTWVVNRIICFFYGPLDSIHSYMFLGWVAYPPTSRNLALQLSAALQVPIAYWALIAAIETSSLLEFLGAG